MNSARRHLLRGALSSATLSIVFAANLLRPGKVHAAPYYEVARRASGPAADLLSAMQNVRPMPSDELQLIAPSIAEDGANVYVQCSTTLPDVDGFTLFAEHNPQPLIAAFWIAPNVVTSLSTRIKLGRTSNVMLVARSRGQFFATVRPVVVTVGGCGVGLN